MAKNISSQFTPHALNSAASTNATVVKASAGTIQQAFIFNASAATKYVRFYDKATAPTVGTDVPLFVLAVPATSSKELILGDNTGLNFKNGIGIAVTGGAARLDATAVAVGDVQTYINYV